MALTDENGQIVTWLKLFSSEYYQTERNQHLLGDYEINQFIINYFEHNSIDSVDQFTNSSLLNYLFCFPSGRPFIKSLYFGTIDFIFSKNPEIQSSFLGYGLAHDGISWIIPSLILLQMIDEHINFRGFKKDLIRPRFENDIYQHRYIYFLIKLLSYPHAQFLLKSNIEGSYSVGGTPYNLQFKNIHELISTKAFHTTVYRKIGYIIINNQMLRMTNLTDIVFDKLYS